MADDPTTDPPAPPAPPDPPADPPKPDEPLGEPGKKALDEERAARREAERLLRKAEADLEAARRSTLSEDERKLAEARDEGKREATKEATDRLFSAEVRAAAGGKLANPNLLKTPAAALDLLGLTEVPVTKDGELDTEAISAAIDSLLEREPYLAAPAGATPSKPSGSADGGPRGGAASGPVQLTQADLKTMTPEQIVAAKEAGQFRDLLGVS